MSVVKYSQDTLDRIREYKNLRCVRDYARNNVINNVKVRKVLDGGAVVSFDFEDVYFVCNFASYTVACGWVKSRRSWGAYKILTTHPEPDGLEQLDYVYGYPYFPVA